MTNDEYIYGKHGFKYGIYNSCAKSFQFGISEDTPMLAEARLHQHQRHTKDFGTCSVRRIQKGQ